MKNIFLAYIKDSDVDDIVNLYMNNNYEYATGMNRGIDIIDVRNNITKKLSDEKDEIRLIKKNDRLIGIIINFYDINYGVIWIKLFLIDEKYRNIGIGSYVIKNFEECIEKRYVNKIYISVSEKNYIGLNFWIKNGYREINALEEENVKEDIKILYKKI